MSAFDSLLGGLTKGRDWELMGDSEKVRALLSEVYDERCHMGKHHKDAYQVRVNLQKADDAASYAGWITADNEKSGPYQGTSFVWFPGASGSVAVLVIGTEGFGADTGILGRPGHARRLRALSRLHKGRVWVKPDLLDISSEVPDPTSRQWPDIASALKAYSRVIYAATAVRGKDDGEAVADLLDLFFHEHHTPLTGAFKTRWEKREAAIAGAVSLPSTKATLSQRSANAASSSWTVRRGQARRGWRIGSLIVSALRRRSSSTRPAPTRISCSVYSRGPLGRDSRSKSGLGI